MSNKIRELAKPGVAGGAVENVSPSPQSLAKMYDDIRTRMAEIFKHMPLHDSLIALEEDSELNRMATIMAHAFEISGNYQTAARFGKRLLEDDILKALRAISVTEINMIENYLEILEKRSPYPSVRTEAGVCLDK